MSSPATKTVQCAICTKEQPAKPDGSMPDDWGALKDSQGNVSFACSLEHLQQIAAQGNQDELVSWTLPMNSEWIARGDGCIFCGMGDTPSTQNGSPFHFYGSTDQQACTKTPMAAGPVQ